MHRDAGQSRAEAIRSAIREIRVPLVGSTVTPIVVFLPLISITGVTGVFFRALAVTVGMALLTSLALALTWTPTLSHYFLRGKPASAGPRITTPFRRGSCGPTSARFVSRWSIRLVLALFTILLIAGSYLCYTHTGSDLLPAMDEGGFIVDYSCPQARRSRNQPRDQPRGKDLAGHAGSSHYRPPHGPATWPGRGHGGQQGDISVKLKPMAPICRDAPAGTNERNRSGDVIADVRPRSPKEPVLDVEFPQLLQDMIGDLTSAPQPVVIKLFSQDADLLRHWAPLEASAIKKIPGVVDVEDGIDNTTSGTAVTFNVDPVVAARAGFTPQEVELDASAMLQGEPATPPVVLNARSYTIRVQFPPASREKPGRHAQHADRQRNGQDRYHRLARHPDGNSRANRDHPRKPAAHGQCDGAVRRSISATAWRSPKGVADSNLPPSIRVDYGGQYAEQQKSFRDLVFVLALAIVLVFMVLLFEFGDFGAPIAVLSSALLSTCGVFLALLVTRTTFNLSSFMGLIMVVGIVAKNGILLLDADQKFRAEGIPAEDSMIRAGERRLRPIMMTALATVAGMLPLAFASRRGLSNASTSGDRGDRRNYRLDGSLSRGHAGCPLLSGGRS